MILMYHARERNISASSFKDLGGVLTPGKSIDGGERMLMLRWSRLRGTYTLPVRNIK